MSRCRPGILTGYQESSRVLAAKYIIVVTAVVTAFDMNRLTDRRELRAPPVSLSTVCSQLVHQRLGAVRSMAGPSSSIRRPHVFAK
jgi:hypothetical protein